METKTPSLEGDLALCWIYVTVPNLDEATALGHTLVKEKLCACANILPGMISIYEWKNKIEQTQEVVVLFKTIRQVCDQAILRIKSLHSYEIPCIIILPIEKALPDFHQWVIQGCQTN